MLYSYQESEHSQRSVRAERLVLTLGARLFRTDARETSCAGHRGWRSGGGILGWGAGRMLREVSNVLWRSKSCFREDGLLVLRKRKRSLERNETGEYDSPRVMEGCTYVHASRYSRPASGAPCSLNASHVARSPRIPSTRRSTRSAHGARFPTTASAGRAFQDAQHACAEHQKTHAPRSRAFPRLRRVARTLPCSYPVLLPAPCSQTTPHARPRRPTLFPPRNRAETMYRRPASRCWRE